MRTHRPLLLGMVFVFHLAASGAQEPKAPNRTVGQVFGKDITAADIGLTAPIDTKAKFDARDTAQWELMGRIMVAFGKPIVDRFIQQQRIEATADEIDRFKASMRANHERNLRKWRDKLAEVKRDLASPDLSATDKEKLEKELAQYERLVASLSEPRTADVSDALPRMFIVQWKTERQLHRIYGGRVIFQQAGPEALDARRRLFEQAERDRDLRFDDPGVRHLFYYYANMKHIVIDEKALEQPWFLADPE